MLDYLYLCADQFENLHGVKPNVLYLNNHHLEYLMSEQEGEMFLPTLVSQFDINIVLSPSITHPSVGRV